MNRKEFFLISIGVFLTVLAWLVADIYHAAFQERVKDNVTLPPITVNAIQSDTLKILKSKKE
ncbi:hypothetical protein HYT33_03870 [Candidatus Roizmanbacteria bacterium]|nr:hypothetical protein [Candidatus Roizmanbacteria bacterium]